MNPLRFTGACAPVLCLTLILGAATGARAEKADRERPTTVEADRMQYDDVKRINVFTGNVTLTKGTMVIRGDRIVVREDAEGFQYGTAWGNPATYRQKRDGGADQYVEGYAQVLDYDGRQEVVRLQQKAQLRRLERDRVTNEIHGSLIVYESRTEFLSVDSGAVPTPGNPSGRVRVVIQPRAAAASGTAQAQAAPLKPDPGPPSVERANPSPATR